MGDEDSADNIPRFFDPTTGRILKDPPRTPCPTTLSDTAISTLLRKNLLSRRLCCELSLQTYASLQPELSRIISDYACLDERVIDLINAMVPYQYRDHMIICDNFGHAWYIGLTRRECASFANDHSACLDSEFEIQMYNTTTKTRKSIFGLHMLFQNCEADLNSESSLTLTSINDTPCDTNGTINAFVATTLVRQLHSQIPSANLPI
jgi:hypothetical protein